MVLQSPSPAPEQNIRFHSLIAEATHNPVITSTMNRIFDVLTPPLLAGERVKGNLEYSRIELGRDLPQRAG